MIANANNTGFPGATYFHNPHTTATHHNLHHHLSLNNSLTLASYYSADKYLFNCCNPIMS